jgi:myosin heavy subunit
MLQALGEYEYTLLTNEPPPTDVDSAALEAKARAAEAQEESSSFETLYRKQLDLEEENQALASQVRDMKVEVSEMEEGLETKVCSAREEAEKEASRLSEAVQEKDLHIEELKSQNVSLVSTIESLTQEKEKLTLEKQTLEEKQDDTEVVPLGTYNDISEKYERLLKDFEDMKSERHRALEMPSIAPVVVHNESVEPRGDAAPTVMKTPQKPNPSEESGQMDQYITPKATHSATSSLENSPKKMFAMHQQQGIVSPEALSTILDSLLLAKQGSGQVEDETLYNDAIQMLQEELSKLSIKARFLCQIRVGCMMRSCEMCVCADGK